MFEWISFFKQLIYSQMNMNKKLHVNNLNENKGKINLKLILFT